MVDVTENTTIDAPSDKPKAQRFVYSSLVIPGVAIALDIAVILISGLLTYLLIVDFNKFTVEYYAFCVLFVTFFSAFIMNRAGLYDMGAIMRPISRSDYIIVSIVTAFLFFLSVAFSLKASDIFSRIWLYSFAGATTIGIIVVRIVLYRVLLALSRRHLIGRSMVVLGLTPQSARFLTRIETVKPHFTALQGVYDHTGACVESEHAGHPILGDIDALFEAARRGEIDDVVIAMPWNADKQLAETVEKLKELPVNVFLSSDLAGFQLAFRPALGDFRELPMFEVVKRPISGWSSLLKSIEDYVLAGLILIMLAPLLILVAIAVKLDSPGPVFFMQPRLGFNNQRFEIFKFRSMYHKEIPENRVQQATKDDPRITRVGRFIRKTSIDELPQLLNVLNGTMSLVGPRPHALSHNEEFSRTVRGYFARHKVKPGITGWAQVNGLRGETDTLDKIKARVEHDIYYADNWSLAFDLRILVSTVLVVLFQRNAY